jgi:putative transposase
LSVGLRELTHSEDLRKRVVDFVEKGGSKADAQRLFQVSEWCVYDWLKKGKDLKAGKPGPKGPRKFNLRDFESLVLEKPEAYLDELGKELNVGKTTAWRACQQLGLSRKKNQSLQRTERE